MGSKLSSHQGSQPTSPAPVCLIASDGSLKELPSARSVAVSHVLGDEAASFFVCSSDALYFNQHPPALGYGEQLRPGQIYFVLPAAMLGRQLSSADMAALAVRANAALATKKPKQRGRRHGGKKVRVTPVQEGMEDGEDVLFNEKLNERTLGEVLVPLSPAPSKTKRMLSGKHLRRLKRALSVIQEDAE